MEDSGSDERRFAPAPAAPSSVSRREFVYSVLASGLALTSHARASVICVLSAAESATLAAVANALVPGAAQAQAVQMVAAMLVRSDPLLSDRFVSLPLPIRQFYRQSLAAIGRYCENRYQQPFFRLCADAQAQVLAELAAASLQPWEGPPPGIVYFVLRSDAVDAMYGSPKAYARLDIPYMAHIEPPAGW